MSRYFFHVEDGVDLRDEEGEALPDDHAARLSCVQIMSELLQSRGESIWKDERLVVHVEREGVGRVFSLRTSIEPAE